MRALLKRLGAVGTVLLVLNEVRGVIVVATVLEAATRAHAADGGQAIVGGLTCAMLAAGC